VADYFIGAIMERESLYKVLDICEVLNSEEEISELQTILMESCLLSISDIYEEWRTENEAKTPLPYTPF
jgi:hypothetical protein